MGYICNVSYALEYSTLYKFLFILASQILPTISVYYYVLHTNVYKTTQNPYENLDFIVPWWHHITQQANQLPKPCFFNLYSVLLHVTVFPMKNSPPMCRQVCSNVSTFVHPKTNLFCTFHHMPRQQVIPLYHNNTGTFIALMKLCNFWYHIDIQEFTIYS